MSLASVAVAVVVLVAFFDTFSQFLVAPYARSLGAAAAVIGFTVAVYSATNLGGNLLAGYLMDRFGRKLLLISGLVAAAGAVLLYGFARDPSELMVVRAVHGLAAAVLAPAAFTLLGDLFPKERRGRAMGLNGSLIAVAAIVAPPVSGFVRDRLGFDAVFVMVAALLLLAAALAWALLRETYRPETLDPIPPGIFLTLLARPPLLVSYAAAVAITYGLGTIVTFLSLHLEDLGYRSAQAGLAFSAFAVLALFAMAGPLSRSKPGRGRIGRVAWGLVLVGASLLFLAISTGLLTVVVGMALFGLGFGLIFPAVNALVADVTAPAERGTAFGLFYAFYSAGVVLGAGAGGLVAGLGPGLAGPFSMASIVGLLAGGAILLAGRRVRFSSAGEVE